MTHWTLRLVEARLAEAAAFLKRLPADKRQVIMGRLPTRLSDFGRHDSNDAPSATPLPSSKSIQRVKEALAWTKDLSPQDYEIVWARAFGLPWKAICRTVGLQRTAAYTNWRAALSRIALGLNGSPIPRDASQRHIIERASAAKR
jgi:hypothetical protein